MHNLIDRYIGVATRHLPEKSRTEAARDIRVMIDEMVEARVIGGEEPGEATTAVLNELGDPAQVARSFEDRPRYLIGPQLFPHYSALLKTLLTWIPGLVFAVLLTVNVLAGDEGLIPSLVEGLLDSFGTAFVVAVQIAFWVTLTYAIMEWSQTPWPEEQESGDAWTVADLPDQAPRRQIGVFDVVWGVGVMAFLGTWLVVQDVRGIASVVRSDLVSETLGDRVVPVINPGIPGWMIVAAFALIAATAIVEIVKFAVGNWTLPVVVAEIVSALAWIALPVIVIQQWGLLNPEIERLWDNGVTEWVFGDEFEQLVVLGFVVVSVWSVVEAILGYRAYRRRPDESATAEHDFVFIV